MDSKKTQHAPRYVTMISPKTMIKQKPKIASPSKMLVARMGTTKVRLPPRSLLTIRRGRARRENWKFRMLMHSVYWGILLALIVLGAGLFVGLQKVDSMTRHLRLREVWNRTRTDVINACQAGATSGDDCAMARKRLVEETWHALHGHRLSANMHSSHYGRALVYAYTVISTIGYGTVASMTTMGKLVTIFYAILGIPFFVAYLNYGGQRLQYRLLRIYEQLRCRLGGGKGFVLSSSSPEDCWIFLFLLLVFLAYLCAVAGAYALFENWPYWESLYFAYQSMALIGFGDVNSHLESPAFVMLHLTVTTVGIIILAICFFVLRNCWTKAVRGIAQRAADKLNMKTTVPVAPAAKTVSVDNSEAQSTEATEKTKGANNTVSSSKTTSAKSATPKSASPSKSPPGEGNK